MRRIFAPAAAAAVAFSLALPAVSLADTFSNPNFDLGVNVTGIDTPAAAQTLLASLSPTARQAVVGGCRNYVANPADVTDPSTLPFCRVALNAPAGVNTRTSPEPIGTAATPAPATNGSAIDWNAYYGS